MIFSGKIKYWKVYCKLTSQPRLLSAEPQILLCGGFLWFKIKFDRACPDEQRYYFFLDHFSFFVHYLVKTCAAEDKGQQLGHYFPQHLPCGPKFAI
jgi:hypothetical protein